MVSDGDECTVDPRACVMYHESSYLYNVAVAVAKGAFGGHVVDGGYELTGIWCRVLCLARVWVGSLMMA